MSPHDLYQGNKIGKQKRSIYELFKDGNFAHLVPSVFCFPTELFENISTGSRPRIKSSPVSPPMEISLFAEEIRLLKTFQSEIERIGIHFSINESLEESDEVSVVIQAVPSVFVEREVSEVKRGRQSVTASKVKVIHNN